MSILVCFVSSFSLQLCRIVDVSCTIEELCGSRTPILDMRFLDLRDLFIMVHLQLFRIWLLCLGKRVNGYHGNICSNLYPLVMYLLRSGLEGDIEIVWKYTIWLSRSYPQLHKIFSPAVDRVHSWSSWVRGITQLVEHFPSMLQVMNVVPSTTNTGSRWYMSMTPEVRTLGV